MSQSHDPLNWVLMPWWENQRGFLTVLLWPRKAWSILWVSLFDFLWVWVSYIPILPSLPRSRQKRKSTRDRQKAPAACHFVRSLPPHLLPHQEMVFLLWSALYLSLPLGVEFPKSSGSMHSRKTAGLVYQSLALCSHPVTPGCVTQGGWAVLLDICWWKELKLDDL